MNEYTFTFTDEEVALIANGLNALEKVLSMSALKSPAHHETYHETSPKIEALAEKIANVMGIDASDD